MKARKTRILSRRKAKVLVDFYQQKQLESYHSIFIVLFRPMIPSAVLSYQVRIVNTCVLKTSNLLGSCSCVIVACVCTINNTTIKHWFHWLTHSFSYNFYYHILSMCTCTPKTFLDLMYFNVYWPLIRVLTGQGWSPGCLRPGAESGDTWLGRTLSLASPGTFQGYKSKSSWAGCLCLCRICNVYKRPIDKA